MRFDFFPVFRARCQKVKCPEEIKSTACVKTAGVTERMIKTDVNPLMEKKLFWKDNLNVGWARLSLEN